MHQPDLIVSMGQGTGTNMTCEEYVEVYTPTGCERCGKDEGLHEERQTRRTA